MAARTSVHAAEKLNFLKMKGPTEPKEAPKPRKPTKDLHLEIRTVALTRMRADIVIEEVPLPRNQAADKDGPAMVPLPALNGSK